MAKYKASSKSDMNKWAKDVEKSLYADVKQQAQKDTYDIECPHCGKEVSVKPGETPCPACGETVKLELNFNF